MFLPNDLSARLKSLRRHRSLDVDSGDKVLVAWTLLVLAATLVVIVVVLLSFQRFGYWSDVDHRLASIDKTPAYDENKLDAILKDFDAKKRRSADILSTAVVKMEMVSASGTVATSSEPESETE